MALEIKVTFFMQKELDLQSLIEDGYVDENELVAAIENNDGERIMDILQAIRNTRDIFMRELGGGFESVDTSERSVEIVYNGQTIKANL